MLSFSIEERFLAEVSLNEKKSMKLDMSFLKETYGNASGRALLLKYFCTETSEERTVENNFLVKFLHRLRHLFRASLFSKKIKKKISEEKQFLNF